MDDQDGLYWSTNMLQAIDTRHKFWILSKLQGDNMQSFVIYTYSVKTSKLLRKGNSAEQIQFIDDESDDSGDQN
jgi:phospholipid-binding lipoprotein MlaA